MDVSRLQFPDAERRRDLPQCPNPAAASLCQGHGQGRVPDQGRAGNGRWSRVRATIFAS